MKAYFKMDGDPPDEHLMWMHKDVGQVKAESIYYDMELLGYL